MKTKNTWQRLSEKKSEIKLQIHMKIIHQYIFKMCFSWQEASLNISIWRKSKWSYQTAGETMSQLNIFHPQVKPQVPGMDDICWNAGQRDPTEFL